MAKQLKEYHLRAEEPEQEFLGGLQCFLMTATDFEALSIVPMYIPLGYALSNPNSMLQSWLANHICTMKVRSGICTRNKDTSPRIHVPFRLDN